jgi:hypothetical protein
MVLAVLAVAGAQAQDAQAPAAQPAAAPLHKAAHAHKHPAAAQAAALPAQAVPAPVQPKAPEAPHWPANEHPSLASVTWDSQGLRIEATNSSLQQILNDVSAATGAKVEGFASDERIFGAYGPGRARDVLSSLLHGSGYNVIMIGDQGQGAPRQIVLSSRHGQGAPPSAAPNATDSGDEDAADSDVDDQPQAPSPPPVRPAFAPGGPARNPQQIMQDMQQRREPQQGASPQNY